MKTLAVISHKGGAGKTSSAVMLAEDLARRGLRVVVIDADRQRGAGLLLGLDQPASGVQQTHDPRLRYFSSAGVPLRELPARSEELSGLFDVGVVDTPSLDDPLARGWLQLSSAALMVIPVEPVSLKTLSGAEAALEGLRNLNPRIELLGLLPTMFDETDSTQRTLMLELRSRRPEGLLPPIPQDRGLAHRAAQKTEQRTEASDTTRAAYHAAGDAIVRSLGPDAAHQPTPKAGAWSPAAGGPSPESPFAEPVGAPGSGPEVGSRPDRAAALLLVAALLALAAVLFTFLRPNG